MPDLPSSHNRLSPVAIAEKNKLGSESVWYQMIEVVTDYMIGHNLRIVKNHEEITWREQNWLPTHFEIDEIGEHNKGEIPRVTIRFSNINKVFQTLLGHYDTYCKNHGISPLECKIYFVNSLNLASSTPEVEYSFILQQPSTNNQWATFILSGANIYSRKFPKNQVIKNHCRFDYKSDRCGATAHHTSCGKTLQDCRARNNSSRFGGFPSAGLRGFQFVT